MKKSELKAMFDIVEWGLAWDKNCFSSYDEFEEIKDKIINKRVLTFDQKKKAYHAVQSTRFYFNANSDNWRYKTFDKYYKMYIAEYYDKSFGEPKNEYSACYIATAAYGSYDAPQVLVLRRYRDLYLRKRSWGKIFITVYYRVSPILVEKFANKMVINRAVRLLLDPLVYVLKKKY